MEKEIREMFGQIDIENADKEVKKRFKEIAERIEEYIKSENSNDESDLPFK